MAEAFTKSDVEILISTMDRQSLDFLGPMFPFTHFSNFNILVVNQTKERVMLVSEHPTVRVINSSERGLSKSRNTALQNAEGRIILLTDDDVVFTDDFLGIIVESFNKHRDAAAIQFMVSDNEGNIYKKYPASPGKINNLRILSSMSVELVYNRDIVNKFSFDENFGLGASFPLGEEHIFLKDIKDKGFTLLFEPYIIVKHPEKRNSGSLPYEKKFESVGAYFTRMFPKTYFFWIKVFIFFSLKQGRVSFTRVPRSFKIAINGSSKYKRLQGN